MSGPTDDTQINPSHDRRWGQQQQPQAYGQSYGPGGTQVGGPGQPPQQYGSGMPPQPPRKQPVWLFAVLGVLVVALIVGVTWFGLRSFGTLVAKPAPSEEVMVEVSEVEVSETPTPTPSVEPTPTVTVTVEVVETVKVQQPPRQQPEPNYDTGSAIVHADQYAKECVRTYDPPFSAAARNNKSTSCPFVINVREAYVASGLAGYAGTVEAYSPTTKKWYVMKCERWDDWNNSVLCTGGVRARVLIYDGMLAPAG